MKSPANDPLCQVKPEIFARLAAAYLDKACYDSTHTSHEVVELTEFVYAEGYHSVYMLRSNDTVQVSMPKGYDFDSIQECWKLFCGKGMFFGYLTEHGNWLFCANIHLPVETLLAEYRSNCLSEAYASLVWYLDNLEKYGEVGDPYGYNKCYGQKSAPDQPPFKIPYRPRNKAYGL